VAGVRTRYDDALGEADEADQRRADARMRRELAERESGGAARPGLGGARAFRRA
jgi:hypothetical protein